jgi:transcriptional regulator with XRE-family HTH domain
MLVMRAARVLHPMPLYLLARHTGISPGRLSLIEREFVQASADERQKIAQALGVAEECLFQGATVATFAGAGARGEVRCTAG